MTHKALETILRELNPLHDMDNINFQRMDVMNDDSDNFEDSRKAFYHNLAEISWGAYFAKNVLRGFVAGSAFGLTIGMMIDYPLNESIIDGSILGLVIDVKQVGYRAVYKYFKSQFLE
ncbi:MAG: hypothetical protein Q8R37_05545 [Nanoarchaeota archaeon]|nr:hypothetical protein [Nanoarchaeota archaeon]